MPRPGHTTGLDLAIAERGAGQPAWVAGMNGAGWQVPGEWPSAVVRLPGQLHVPEPQ